MGSSPLTRAWLQATRKSTTKEVVLLDLGHPGVRLQTPACPSILHSGHPGLRWLYLIQFLLEEPLDLLFLGLAVAQ